MYFTFCKNAPKKVKRERKVQRGGAEVAAAVTNSGALLFWEVVIYAQRVAGWTEPVH